MKNLIIILAAVAALSSCVEHKRPTSSSSFKKVRAKLAARVGNRVVVSRITSIIEVDTMYQINDTINYGNSMYIITK
jgi:hypothetical protein